MYYDYLGNNQYRVYIDMYRDCNSSGAQFDNPLYLGVFTGSGVLIDTYSIPFPGSTVLPIIFNNPCATPPNDICTEKAVYTTILTLPPVNGGYTLTYQRCCRGPNITNIFNPDDTGFTLTCRIPGVETGAWENSSPRFTNYPPLLLCNTDDLLFDHSATDPDGDQLIYSLVTPFAGASGLSPQPNPPPPPNYPLVQWLGGFSATSPLGNGSNTTLDAGTGMLFVEPQLLGLFVVGVRVQEMRNGVVINSTVRDFLFEVFDCNIQLNAILPTQEQLTSFSGYCDGLTINFENNSYGGTNYAWDFGVPGTNTDVSSAFEPTYTYPSDGTYLATLIVNPGEPCTDTAYIEITVANPIDVAWTAIDSICFLNNSFDFTAFGDIPPGSEFNWDFGQYASTPNVNGNFPDVNDISFNTTGFVPITVDIAYESCTDSYTDSIYIFPLPNAQIIVPNDIECDGLAVDFGNGTTEANMYEWDFDGLGTSNEFAPSFTFPGPGEYEITLIAGSGTDCMDTTSETINLYDPLYVSFTTQDSMCFTDNSFDFDGTTSGPPGYEFIWNFGPDASIQTSTEEDVNGVSFSTFGSVPVTLTGTFLNCIVTETQEIYIYQPPSIDFGLLPGLQCAPFEAHFIDGSFAETGITYDWDFGDGFGSNEANPVHIYNNPGSYPVTLVIWTSAGCVDTLIDFQPDLVNVYPNPVAGFSIDPEYTDICNSSVQFTDESSGATYFRYAYGDGILSDDDANPVHVYIEDGMMYPVQYVENEFGCFDSTMRSIYIEPFPLYIPNTFTPDGDEFNNVFKPRTYLDVFEWNMKIYNRWGELLFETNDFDIGWDGVGRNGRLVQDGMYQYIIEMLTCEPLAVPEVITGHVNVLR